VDGEGAAKEPKEKPKSVSGEEVLICTYLHNKNDVVVLLLCGTPACMAK